MLRVGWRATGVTRFEKLTIRDHYDCWEERTLAILTKLEEALRARDFAGLREAVDHLPPADLANLISELPGEQQAPIFRIPPRKTAATTFEYLPLEKQEEVLKSLAQEDVAAILALIVVSAIQSSGQENVRQENVRQENRRFAIFLSYIFLSAGRNDDQGPAHCSEMRFWQSGA